VFAGAGPSLAQNTQPPTVSAPAEAPARADDPAEAARAAEASRRVNRLSDQLKSPFCPGKTLLSCTSGQAYQLRQEMARMILDGKSDAEILAALRDSFEEELENPPQPWYTVLVPILPFLLGGLIAAWVFAQWLRGSRAAREERAEVAVDVSEAQRERLKALMRDDL
jgi:cytochrome c-type biogenesis protein CcmH